MNGPLSATDIPLIAALRTLVSLAAHTQIGDVVSSHRPHIGTRRATIIPLPPTSSRTFIAHSLRHTVTLG